MAYTDINPDVVYEVSQDVHKTRAQLAQDLGDFQAEVFNKIEESWYNENAVKVMPDAVTTVRKLKDGISESLQSLGFALAHAAQTWAQANGASGYPTAGIMELDTNFHCDVKDNKNGFRGMDVDVIQEVVYRAESIKGTMIERLNNLKTAGEREGVRGGNMQQELTNVCLKLKLEIEMALNKVIDNITSNTGTAKSNVETARTTTESTFTIS